jgi:WD40 repeat protein
MYAFERLKCAYCDKTEPVNAIDISYDGQIVVTSANDEYIRIYDSVKGK